ncbi:uncharacterized protein ARMOST_19580 [Armillaria ostoyae]|uniref:Uncharacterized protein n=1 Tax=Armillaria ostoyae TaxID=47428 RepID=A0A284S4X7_ARMOS|nr:uncharacterized protein ARMOST_19580 [Armillaria ostoyae]
MPSTIKTHQAEAVLEAIYGHSKGWAHHDAWLPQESFLGRMCMMITEEFEKAKENFSMTTSDVTAEFLEDFDIQDCTGDKYSEVHLPIWRKVIIAATSSKTLEKNKKRTTDIGRAIITAQTLHLHSIHNAKLQTIFGLFAWVTGASKKMMEVLSHCSLSTSFPTTQGNIDTLANMSISSASEETHGPHGCVWDNVTLSSSDHVEQTSHMMSKAQSGTFPVIYWLHNVQH